MKSTEPLNLRPADASDAMDRLGIRGILTDFLPGLEAAPIAGPAFPVLVRRSKGLSKTMREGLLDAITAAPVGSILVVQSESSRYSVWGGFLSLQARKKGIVGVVVDGAARDFDETRELGFPVYSRARTPASGYGRLAVSAVGKPIRIDSVLVHQGDLVLADSDGVAIVPKSELRRVIQRAQETREAERQQRER